MILLAPVLLAPPAARETPAMIQARWERRLAGKPLSQRWKMLQDGFDRTEPIPLNRESDEALIIAGMIRESAGMMGFHFKMRRNLTGERDLTLLRAAFLLTGEDWPRKIQTEILLKLGGSEASQSVRFWYEAFPILSGLEWDFRKWNTLGNLCRKFPALYFARLLRFEYGRSEYAHKPIGLPFTPIPLAVHEEAKRDVDRAYDLAVKTFGPDQPWNVEMKAKLDRRRKEAGQ